MSGTFQLVCGHCGQINRLPAGRAPTQGKCGKCHAPLFSGHPIEVDQAAFERHVAHSDLPLLVDVWAPWCGPCRAMAPMFARAAEALEPRVQLLKLNSDEAPEISAKFGISGIPTLLLLQKGRELARISGAMDSQRIVAWTLSGLRQ
ncbi:MAG: thioredoxin TrxC [Bradyrhizobium sp.]|jgi:thioredoxin 2|uniref:Thioredoxin n=1 Tax=Bradyrhizobium denitrificans TaxID=2734912 RepID=A0ABS5GE46_9BRAD|nr:MULTISPECIES: thioredoxin TrxC [Bradyrhizobium]ABQ35801.1 thioredoxin [Bradyrhizobium sp. BTAi1]MBR1139609.1 thioredoxin TrxC [Bradyrhizobium denitrificans]MDU1495388.1 thioredoxin TrxC [Bradyrhizobium sp.]MDU1545425.1 thioredoxin TrxC [Bradyrhizobium sp.]MDU1670037.1 thioredoxin TrxC [Bradyrhizobium sp.]